MLTKQHNRRRVLMSAVLTVAAVAAATALSSGIRAIAEDAAVNIDNFTFEPTVLTVKAGTTVTWKNVDDIPHTVTSSTKVFRSKALDTDDSFSFTFQDPGTYDYFCSLHPKMTATVKVEPAAK